MLILLSVFSMMAIAMYNKGISETPVSSDPEWEKKGGDDSMSAAAPALMDKVDYKNTYRELPGSMPLETKVDTSQYPPLERPGR